MIFYVDIKSDDYGCGTKEHPFKNINEAAKIAKPGDQVIVAPGVYREYVNPANGGTEDKRIVYRSSEYRKAVITGAEEVKNWKNIKGDVWLARIPNGIFGSYNPYTVKVAGDWFNVNFVAHTGEVFLNNKSLYEVTKLEAVENPVEEILARKGWENVTAVKNKAVYSIDNTASSLPNHNIIQALKEIAKAVYPEQYANID